MINSFDADDLNRASTASDCLARCNDEPQCKFWDYGQKICRLRSNPGSGPIKDDGYSYGSKNCIFQSGKSKMWSLQQCHRIQIYKPPTFIELSSSVFLISAYKEYSGDCRNLFSEYSDMGSGNRGSLLACQQSCDTTKGCAAVGWHEKWKGCHMYSFMARTAKDPGWKCYSKGIIWRTLPRLLHNDHQKIAHLVLFQKTNWKFIFFPVFAYQYRSNKYMIGSHLGSFASLDEVITYCNSHSNCYGIMDDGCDGGYYYARGYGSLLTPTYSPSCSWVMKLNY